MEFYQNIVIAGFWLFSILLCLIILIRLLVKKQSLSLKLIPISLLLIPIFDLTLGITNTLRDQIKGEIVLDIIDDSFLTTKSLIVREKNEKLTARFHSSVAGFGDTENAQIKILNDSSLFFKISKREYSESLIFNKQNQILYNKEKNLNYRVLKNTLLK